jgi:diguanylate cyclase
MIELVVVLTVVALAALAVALLLRRARRREGPAATATERGVENASQALRRVILRLAEVIHRVDDAADASSLSLNDVREEVRKLALANGLQEAQVRLIEEIDRVISTNTTLRGELENARDNLEEQRRQIDTLRTAVRVDSLTGLANRAAFDEHLAESWQHHERYNEDFVLLMIDLDHFKRINDTHGHPAGDRILKGVAVKLKASLRGADFVARYGGEEFAVILPHTAEATAEEVAQKLREGVAQTKFHLDHTELRLTISIGLAATSQAESAAELVALADRALYQAKSDGRDCVRAAASPG